MEQMFLVAGGASGSGRPRAPSLGIDAKEREEARVLLGAVWCLIGAEVRLPISKTEWSKRNIRVAMDLAQQGVTVEQVEKAWRAASKRMGGPIRTMRIVQDELMRIATPAPKKHEARPAQDKVEPDLPAEQRAKNLHRLKEMAAKGMRRLD